MLHLILRKSLFLFLLSISSLGFTQTGTIKGTIYNPRDDAALPFANISLVNSEYKTNTDLEGKFWFLKIEPATYDLKINLVGYRDTIIRGIEVLANEVISLNITYPSPCPNVKDLKNKRCPVCLKKDQVIPILWGLPSEEASKEAENGKVYLGGCLVSDCDPKWYCKRDKKKFTN